MVLWRVVIPGLEHHEELNLMGRPWITNMICPCLWYWIYQTAVMSPRRLLAVSPSGLGCQLGRSNTYEFIAKKKKQIAQVMTNRRWCYKSRLPTTTRYEEEQAELRWRNRSRGRGNFSISHTLGHSGTAIRWGGPRARVHAMPAAADTPRNPNARVAEDESCLSSKKASEAEAQSESASRRRMSEHMFFLVLARLTSADWCSLRPRRSALVVPEGASVWASAPKFEG
jgi:hypothetical protein